MNLLIICIQPLILYNFLNDVEFLVFISSLHVAILIDDTHIFKIFIILDDC